MLLRSLATLGHSLAAVHTIRTALVARPFAMTATLGSASTAFKATSSVTAASLDSLAQHEVDSLYRPFLATKNGADEPDWTAHLELDTVRQMVRDASEQRGQPPIKVLVLYGSLRERCVLAQRRTAPTTAAS